MKFIETNLSVVNNALENLNPKQNKELESLGTLKEKNPSYTSSLSLENTIKRTAHLTKPNSEIKSSSLKKLKNFFTKS